MAGRASDGPAGETELLELDRQECLRLLAGTAIGRIAVTVPGWPEPLLRPVNYVFDESSQSVLIRSGSGSKLHALLRSARAVFEIDGTDSGARAGWSVIVHGATEEVTNSSEVRRLDTLGHHSWAPGEQGHWIRIRAYTVTGRRIAPVTHRDPPG